MSYGSAEKSCIEEFDTRISGSKLPEGFGDWVSRLHSITAGQIEWTLGWLPIEEIVYMPATGPYFLLMGLRGIQPYAPHRVMRQLGRCQLMHPDEYLSVCAVEVSSNGQIHEEIVRSIWNECQYLTANTRVRDLSRGKVSPAYFAWYRKKNTRRADPERPAKKPHIQEFIEASQEQWAWLAKENEYKAIIGKLEKQVRDLQFENGLQAAANEGEKKKLAKENEALRAQIRETKTTAENPARSTKDEKLIKCLRQKVDEYGFDLNKGEGELARARTKLAKNAEERARLVKQLKEKYDNEIVGLNKRVTIFENKMIKQAKDFKAEREHCYAAMTQLERDLQKLQEQNHVAEQTLEARAQQIGRLLQEKGVIKERVRRIADYIAMKYSSCEDMTRSMFFSTTMTFVR
ncbi:protein CROWDED NUCLEI 3-like [Nicotiana sylvestris]|uniref:protein CROWDED NUCLEI 3-like n=1 Tax=Nicotiana sylvestris TaxID=4096 RepID=UPI00388CC012